MPEKAEAKQQSLDDVPELALDFRAASFSPQSVDQETRTVDIVWTTGSRVERYSFQIGRFIEELEVSGKAVDLSRLNAGAPFLNAHSGSWDARSIMANVVPGSAKIDGNQGIAKVRFDSAENDPDAEKVFRKIQAGIVTGVSVGYRVLEMKKTNESVDGIPVYRVTKWEPMEISVAPIPADIGSKFRSFSMPSENEPTVTPAAAAPAIVAPPVAETPKVPTVDPESIRSEERARIQGITLSARAAKFTPEETDALIASGIGLEAARSQIVEEMIKRDAALGKPGSGPPAGISDVNPIGDDAFRGGVENYILHRANPSQIKLSEEGRAFRGNSVVDIAKTYVERSGHSCRGLSKSDVIERAFEVRSGAHSTSDFALLLADVSGKTLRAGYAEAAPSFEPFVRRTTVPDFKTVKRAQLSEFSSLDVIEEDGEYTFGTLGEGQETYAIATYGKGFALTRRAMINDDLSAFSSVLPRMGRAARRKESELVYALLTVNPLMGDGIAVFDAAHANIGVGVIALAGINAAYVAMGLQTGMTDDEYLDLEPAFLVTPKALQATAMQWANGSFVPNSSTAINPYANRFTPIADARLDGSSSLIWYAIASPSAIDTIEFATLEGEEGPYLESRSKWENDSLQFKVRHECGAAVIDHRGLYRSTGAP